MAARLFKGTPFPNSARRENSEKWAIGGDFGVLPFLGFPQLASPAETRP
jgi:hypothetical protein